MDDVDDLYDVSFDDDVNDVDDVVDDMVNRAGYYPVISCRAVQRTVMALFSQDFLSYLSAMALTCSMKKTEPQNVRVVRMLCQKLAEAWTMARGVLHMAHPVHDVLVMMDEDVLSIHVSEEDALKVFQLAADCAGKSPHAFPFTPPCVQKYVQELQGRVMCSRVAMGCWVNPAFVCGALEACAREFTDHDMVVAKVDTSATFMDAFLAYIASNTFMWAATALCFESAVAVLSFARCYGYGHESWRTGFLDQLLLRASLATALEVDDASKAGATADDAIDLDVIRVIGKYVESGLGDHPLDHFQAISVHSHLRLGTVRAVHRDMHWMRVAAWWLTKTRFLCAVGFGAFPLPEQDVHLTNECPIHSIFLNGIAAAYLETYDCEWAATAEYSRGGPLPPMSTL
jgi:hypothetical protein